MSPPQWDIFISHSSRLIPDDEEFIDALALALWKRGYSVFLDRLCLKKNEPLIPSLEKAITSSRLGLVIITPSAARSGFVEYEIQFMRQRRNAGRFQILALMLGPKAVLPPGFSVDKVIIAADAKVMPRLIDEIGKAVGSPSAGVPNGSGRAKPSGG